MKWACNLGDAGLIADDAAREHHLFLVGAHVLAGVPLAAAAEVEHGDLRLTMLDGASAVHGKVPHLARRYPLRRRSRPLRFAGCAVLWLELVDRHEIGWPVGGPPLAAFGHELDG